MGLRFQRDSLNVQYISLGHKFPFSISFLLYQGVIFLGILFLNNLVHIHLV